MNDVTMGTLKAFEQALANYKATPFECRSSEMAMFIAGLEHGQSQGGEVERREIEAAEMKGYDEACSVIGFALTDFMNVLGIDPDSWGDDAAEAAVIEGILKRFAREFKELPIRYDPDEGEFFVTQPQSAVPEWVEELRKLAVLATEGPWHGGHGACLTGVAADYRDDSGNMTRDSFTRTGHAKVMCYATPTQWRPINQVRNDMRFIAAANPSTILGLIAMLNAAPKPLDSDEDDDD